MNNQSPNIPTEEVVDMSPFKKMVMTIGTLPTAYTESMTYYEALSFFVSQLDQLIKVVDQNAEATKELQSLFIELKNYVDNYFDNLDVQEEINNKLDDMAEHGELASIIAQFLELSPVFGYNTIANMAAAENLTSGCIVKVLGKTDPDTGDGSFYRIRNKTVDDTPDGENLVAITNDSSIIAQIIPNYYYNQLAPTVANNAAFVSRANHRKVIVIGDSYGVPNDSWVDKIKDMGGFDDNSFNKNCKNGVGFAKEVNGESFITLLTTGITLNPLDVTDIIVCGGWNDYEQTSANIINAIHNFIETANTNYPNANIYIGFIGWFSSQISNISESFPFNNLNKVRNAYQQGCNYGDKTKYLNNVEYSLHNQADIDTTTHYHPNSNGQVKIADNVFRAWMSGYTNVNSNLEEVTSTFTPAEGLSISNTSRLWSMIRNQTSVLKSSYTSGSSFRVVFDGLTPQNLGDNNILLGEITGGYLMGRGSTVVCTASTFVQTADGEFYKTPTMLYLLRGKLYWRPRVLNQSSTNWLTGKAINFVQFDSIQFEGDSMEQY